MGDIAPVAVEGMRIANEDADKWAVRAKAAEADLDCLKRIEAAARKWRGVPAGTIHGPEVTAAMLELFEAMDRAALSPAEEETI